MAKFGYFRKDADPLYFDSDPRPVLRMIHGLQEVRLEKLTSESTRKRDVYLVYGRRSSGSEVRYERLYVRTTEALREEQAGHTFRHTQYDFGDVKAPMR